MRSAWWSGRWLVIAAMGLPSAARSALLPPPPPQEHWIQDFAALLGYGAERGARLDALDSAAGGGIGVPSAERSPPAEGIAGPRGRRPRRTRTASHFRASLAAIPDDRPSSVRRRRRLAWSTSSGRQLTIMVCNMVGAASAVRGARPREYPRPARCLSQDGCRLRRCLTAAFARIRAQACTSISATRQLREHDAEQAVRAALATLDAIGALNSSDGMTYPGQRWHSERPRRRRRCSLGGAGDKLQQLAIGETLHTWRERLQAEAAPGEIVISASTHRLAGRLFDCRPLDPIVMGELAHPLEAWQVLGENVGISRFDALHEHKLSPLAGRQERGSIFVPAPCRWQ